MSDPPEEKPAPQSRMMHYLVRFGVGLALHNEKTILATVRGWLNGRLEAFSAADLVHGMKDNIDICARPLAKSGCRD